MSKPGASVQPFFRFGIQKNYRRNEALFEELHTKVQKSESRYTAVTGASGIGKTSLVNEYAHEVSHKCTVRWFTFTPSRLIARNNENDKDYVQPQEQVMQLMNKVSTLTTEKKFLFIYDDIESIGSMQHLLSVSLPDNLSVIITTEDCWDIPSHWQFVHMTYPERKIRERILYAEIKPHKSSICEQIVSTVVRRESPVLPIELALVAAFVNSFKLVSDALKENNRLEFYLRDYVDNYGHKSFVYALVKLFTDYRDLFSEFLRKVVFGGPQSLQRIVEDVSKEARAKKNFDEIAVNTALFVLQELQLVSVCKGEYGVDGLYMHNAIAKCVRKGNSDRMGAYKERAFVGIRTKDYLKALIYLKKVIQLKVNEEPVWFCNLEMAELYADAARCFQAMGNEKDAAIYFQKANDCVKVTGKDLESAKIPRIVVAKNSTVIPKKS